MYSLSLPRRDKMRAQSSDVATVKSSPTGVWFLLAAGAFLTGLIALAVRLDGAQRNAARLSEEKQMAWAFADSVLSDLTETRQGLAATAADKETLSHALDVAGENRIKLRGELEDTQRQHRQLAQAATVNQQEWNRYSSTLKTNLDAEATQRYLAESTVVKLEDETSALASAREEALRNKDEAVQANRSLAHEAANLQMGVNQLRSITAELGSANQSLESRLQTAESRNRDLESANSQLGGSVSNLQGCISRLECKVRELECEVSRLRSQGNGR